MHGVMLEASAARSGACTTSPGHDSNLGSTQIVH